MAALMLNWLMLLSPRYKLSSTERCERCNPNGLQTDLHPVRDASFASFGRKKHHPSPAFRRNASLGRKPGTKCTGFVKFYRNFFPLFFILPVVFHKITIASINGDIR